MATTAKNVAGPGSLAPRRAGMTGQDVFVDGSHRDDRSPVAWLVSLAHADLELSSRSQAVAVRAGPLLAIATASRAATAKAA